MILELKKQLANALEQPKVQVPVPTDPNVPAAQQILAAKEEVRNISIFKMKLPETFLLRLSILSFKLKMLVQTNSLLCCRQMQSQRLSCFQRGKLRRIRKLIFQLSCKLRILCQSLFLKTNRLLIL